MLKSLPLCSIISREGAVTNLSPEVKEQFGYRLKNQERTKKMKFSNIRNEGLQIAVHSKTICGKSVKYSLYKLSENEYEISILKDGIEECAIFECDFFRVAELFKVIEDTDTLPENIKEIAEDFATA